MTRILLVRHGESQSNIDGTFTGQANAPLSALGRAQAERTARFILENYTVDAACSSDLSRAYDTALAAAAPLGLTVTQYPALREIGAGLWENLLFSDLPVLYPEEYALWQQDVGNSRCPGGESVAEVADRVWACIMDICRAHPDQTVLIASHATPIRTVQWKVTGQDLSYMKQVSWVSNASVSEYVYENSTLTPVKISQNSHLADMITELPKSI